MIGFAEKLLIAIVIDLAAGDPRWLPHPIVAIGWLARRQESWWRSRRMPLRLAGVGVWCVVVGVAATAVYLSTRWLPEPFVDIYWIYSFLALRSLDQHAMAVVKPLRAGDIDAARQATGMMVGRDTESLSESEVARALIETVSENSSDGVIAPLFWLCLGGPAAMAAYKAINTLDSMFGYRNARYVEFGWWSARADDLANWAPARITAALFWLVAALWPGLHLALSVRATLRDAHRQPSPNSGYPEAAAAGALGVRLGGASWYRGVLSLKQCLGDPVAELSWRTYRGMRVLLYGAAVLFVTVMIGVRRWQ